MLKGSENLLILRRTSYSSGKKAYIDSGPNALGPFFSIEIKNRSANDYCTTKIHSLKQRNATRRCKNSLISSSLTKKLAPARVCYSLTRHPRVRLRRGGRGAFPHPLHVFLPSCTCARETETRNLISRSTWCNNQLNLMHIRRVLPSRAEWPNPSTTRRYAGRRALAYVRAIATTIRDA